jgi:hypothetical protein
MPEEIQPRDGENESPHDDKGLTRRDFIRTAVKIALPAFALLGLGVTLSGCGQDCATARVPGCAPGGGGSGGGGGGYSGCQDACSSSCSGTCREYCSAH